ncbi:MAG: AAA family ATPase [Candidatus Omnitrophica bacterium]|nr:AAA family ATPase [Candidatus Omnitrophota bacterium]
MSYFNLLGIEKEPFSTSPDPSFFYGSIHHRQALANLLIDLRLRRGLSVVIGDIGTGKTTLGRKLIQLLKQRPNFIFHIVLNPTFKSEEVFFDSIAQRFNIVIPEGKSLLEIDYWDLIERFLYKKGIEEDQTIVLIIDEAHKLNPVSLEALRVLLNYETNDSKLLQLVLLGQVELLPLLSSMPNLYQRISLKCILQPLQLEETLKLIEFRLAEAGYHGRKPLFSYEAVQMIHQVSGGYPRNIASLCHRSLRHIAMHGREMVVPDVVKELIQQEKDVEWIHKTISQKNVSCA